MWVIANNILHISATNLVINLVATISNTMAVTITAGVTTSTTDLVIRMDFIIAMKVVTNYPKTLQLMTRVSSFQFLCSF
jgi:hypothetical protein